MMVSTRLARYRNSYKFVNRLFSNFFNYSVKYRIKRATIMDCVVASSTGALKVIDLIGSTFTNVGRSISSLVPKRDEITRICWTNDEQTAVLTAQIDRQLNLYDTMTGIYTPLFNVDGGIGPIKGLDMIQNDIVTATESGLIQVFQLDGERKIEITAGDGLLTMRCNPTKNNCLASGGRENPLKLWDINVPDKPLFTAKNVRPNWLQLRVPVYVSDLRFFVDTNTIATCTGQHQILLYDPRAQRRPVSELEWLDEPFTAMSTCAKAQHIIAGNTRGELALFDLRNKVHKFKGFAGSIRSIDAHSTGTYVASCGVDRFVLIHDVNTKKLIKKIYCKTKLNQILLKNNMAIATKNDGVRAKRRRMT